MLGSIYLAGNLAGSGGLLGATTEEPLVTTTTISAAAVGQQTQWCTQHSRCNRDNRKETRMETVDNRGSKSNGDSGVGLAGDNSLAGSSLAGSQDPRRAPRLASHSTGTT